MRVQRLYNANTVDEIINDPDILPSVAPGCAQFEVDPDRLRNDVIALRYGEALAIFVELAPGRFEGHYLFPASVRGKNALTAAKNLLSTMFTTYCASVIEGHISRENRAARVMTRRLGFRPVDTGRDDVVSYILDAATWVTSLA